MELTAKVVYKKLASMVSEKYERQPSDELDEMQAWIFTPEISSDVFERITLYTRVSSKTKHWRGIRGIGPE